eukprot:4086339-Amphidinium_carterae.2
MLYKCRNKINLIASRTSDRSRQLHRTHGQSISGHADPVHCEDSRQHELSPSSRALPASADDQQLSWQA